MGGITQRALALSVITAGSALALGLASLTGQAQAQTGTWHQSLERSDSDATCKAPANETPWQSSFRGQQEWTPSWAQWPNNGQGGWVCQRTIVWAQTSGPTLPSAGCILTFSGIGPLRYADFRGGYALSGFSDSAALYSDSSCTSPTGQYVGGAVVYSPPGFDANALCERAFGLPAKESPDTPDDVIECEAPD